MKLIEVLQKFRPSDPQSKSMEVLQVKTPGQAARDGDRATLETYRGVAKVFL